NVGIALDLGVGVLDVPIAAGGAVSLLGDGHLSGRGCVAEKDVVADLVVAVGACHPIDGIVKVIDIALRRRSCRTVRTDSRVMKKDVVVNLVVLGEEPAAVGEAKRLPRVVVDDIVINLVERSNLTEI